MNLTLRLGRPDDTHRCGTIFYEAFKVIAEYHGFPQIRPVREGDRELCEMALPSRLSRDRRRIGWAHCWQ